MSNVVIADASSRIVVRREPDISYPLARAVQGIVDPHPDAGTPKSYPMTVQAEARDAADMLEAFVANVPPNALMAWARPLGAAVRNPQSDQDFAAWLAAAAVGLSDYAAGAFSIETQRAALRQFKFWPSVADVAELVGPKSANLRTRHRALRKIADAATEPPRQTPPPGPVPLPEWVGSRSMRKASGPVAEGDTRHSLARPPERTVAEQIEQLMGKSI
jgi:hypothetical protein